jgi:ABC-type lipoprotein export system ATPase subunit
MVAVSACGLRKSFGAGRAARVVLDGVDLDVAAGELVAVVGRSGTGKSTLLHLLGGLDRPDAGEVTIGGTRLDGQRDKELARVRAGHVGFVFQFFHLVPELSGRDNVLLATRVPGAPSGGRERAGLLLRDLGLEHVADQLPHTLSGGEQQRVAIARALVNEPSVVLADEPTGNLDQTAAGEVVARLRAIADSGRAVVTVTHDDEVSAVADRVLRLVDGRLVA